MKGRLYVSRQVPIWHHQPLNLSEQELDHDRRAASMLGLLLISGLLFWSIVAVTLIVVVI